MTILELLGIANKIQYVFLVYSYSVTHAVHCVMLLGHRQNPVCLDWNGKAKKDGDGFFTLINNLELVKSVI